MQRRPALAALTLALAAPSTLAQSGRTQPQVQVWKDPQCGCCQEWVEHLRASGFAVEVHDVGNTAARKRLGMPEKLGSCHTATVGAYVIEGHVPAGDIQRLLKQRPAALGLAVPGMPIGSPGMDGPVYQGRRDAYQVLLVQRDGGTSVFARYAASGPVRPVSGAESAGTAALPWTVAEVRRVDKAARKLSLRHEHIQNLDMPPMTMVFQVREGLVMDNLQAGQRIRFQALQDKGAYWVVGLQPAAL